MVYDMMGGMLAWIWETAPCKYSGGSGTAADPYQIATAEDLMLLGDSPEDYDKHFILTANIDLDPNMAGRKVFDKAVIAPDMNDVSMEYDGIPFTGVFDGNGHIVSHMTIEGESYLGLFGQLGSKAKIHDLGLVAVDINGTNDYVSGLVGYNDGGSINMSYSTGMVMGVDWDVGGLVGYNDCGSITNCYSTGIVRGGEWYVGGLVGRNSGSITTSYSTSMVRGGEEYVGGLVGRNSGSINTSYSTGTVSGGFNVGGLVGLNIRGSITTSYSPGTVSGTSSVGGLVGSNQGGSIVSCYNTGSVSGGWLVGGLVGRNRGSVATSYSTSMVTGSEDVGGLLGYNDGGSVTSSFWDVETSGQETSAGGMGLSTTEMKDINTYLNAGWDFFDEASNGTCNYWQISPDDYPRLRYHAGDSPMMPEGFGTAEEPYLIRDANDLGTVCFEPLAHYSLEASVDLSGITWSTAVIQWFEGFFEGNGHVISNLRIQGGDFLGVFGFLNSRANIKNLGLVDVNITNSGDYIGSLAGRNRGSITTSYSIGMVTGNREIGGLVGSNGGSITTSYSTGTVRGVWRVGGLVGYNEDRASISTSYSTNSVSGKGTIGGLVAYNEGDLIDCYSTGAVRGTYNFGGLVGHNSHGSITMSFWDIETSNHTGSAGGTGKKTAEMQTAGTFIEAGWDFVDEIANGTEDI